MHRNVYADQTSKPPCAAAPAKPPLLAQHMREVIEQAVSSVFGVPHEELRAASRRRAAAAFARQVGMYLAHVGCGFTLTKVGEMFERDRTTVAHGCGLVEDRRDDPVLDRSLTILENAICAVSGRQFGGALQNENHH